MAFVLIGLSHKTAPVEIREQVFIPRTGIGECVRRLIDRDLIESGVLLSTCNRTELYAVSAAESGERRLLDSFGWGPHELAFETWQRHAYRLTGDDAMRHVFRVASGLDSAIVGEAQVLGQMKDALAQARLARVVDPNLQIILHGAIRAGKRTRHETELGRRPVSVSHAAVAKAAEVLGSLAGRGVLLVGAGPMSEVALRLLQKQRIGAVYLTSRTPERADRVARPLGGQAVAFDSIEDIVAGVDIILCSSSAPHHLFDANVIDAFQSRRSNRPLLIIDMAVPRDVDPDVSRVPGIRLFNIDDLETIAETSKEERKAWIPEAERIVEQELRVTRRALVSRQSAVTIKALVNRIEQLRDGVLNRHLARIAPDDVQAREAMRELAVALTAKFLHGPIRALRESPDPTLETAVNDAFGLGEDSS